MDYSLYKAINGLSGSAFFDGLFRALANDLPAVIVAVVAALFLLPWRRERLARRCGAVTATAAAGIALLLNQPIAHAVARTRPYLAHPHHAHLLIARSHDPSFPSDHSTGAFALAAAILFYDRIAGLIVLVLGVLLAFARVYVGTHYPGDVVGGAVIGIAVVLVLRLPVLRRLLEGVARWCSDLWDRILRVARIPT